MLSFILFIILIVLYIFPSGPQCPECNSYFTREFNLIGLHKDTKTEHRIQAKVCFKCNHKWDMYKDGKRVSTFTDAVEDEEDSNE